MTMKRRDALKAMGALAGATAAGGILTGCGDDAPAADAGADAYPDNIPGITTIVVMMMENRSYDHYLGARALEGLGGNGLVATMSNPNRLGVDVPVFLAGGGDATCVLDPPHGWEASIAQLNGGLNNGFLTEYQRSHDNDTITQAMHYVNRSHIPATWAIADSYVSCDQWYCSVLGPTWPNRMYWHTATSQGIQANDLPATGFNWNSIYHRLVEKNIEYAYFYGDVPVLSLIEDIPGNIDRIFRMEDFFSQAARGKLPPVVYIDPAFSANDDHPPHHPILGQQLIASIYTALANSPQWRNCLFVVTYDENGGYYDHVVPPNTAADEFAAQGFSQFGFRVPTIVAGPYVKQGQVISTQYDHTSVLKHIENMFDLDPLYMRSTQASDLSDCLDLDRLANNDPAEPAEIPAIEINESDITDACAVTKEASFHHDMLELADRFAKKIGKLDRRGHVRDYLYTIGDYLESMNMGRIRRGR